MRLQSSSNDSRSGNRDKRERAEGQDCTSKWMHRDALLFTPAGFSVFAWFAPFAVKTLFSGSRNSREAQKLTADCADEGKEMVKFISYPCNPRDPRSKACPLAIPKRIEPNRRRGGGGRGWRSIPDRPAAPRSRSTPLLRHRTGAVPSKSPARRQGRRAG